MINYFSFFGCPENIVTDNGSEFNNDLVKEFLKAHKINVHFGTSGHHESNSPIERFHSTLIEHLRILKSKDKDKSLNELMTFAIIAYNSTTHTVTKFTPFELVFGHTNSRDPLDLISNTFYSEYMNTHKTKINDMYNQVVQKTDEQKEKVISKTNIKGNENLEFKVNQKVYKKLSERSKSKSKFSGPYIIKELLEHNKVKIANANKPSKTEVIHIKELKKPLITDSSE